MDHGGRQMWMWFHTHINDSLLFKSWWIKDVSTMVWSCLVVAVFAVILEAIKWFRWMVGTKRENQESWTSHLSTRSHYVDVAIFVVQSMLSYVLMLVFMTYSVWLCVSLCIGLAVGHYLFGTRRFK